MTYNEEIGEAIVTLLDLKKNKKGRYKTIWGEKTLEGLGASVYRILVEDNNLMYGD